MSWANNEIPGTWWSANVAGKWPFPSRVTENMVIFESGLPRGRNDTISITDDNPKIWWQSNEVYSWPQPPSFPIENVQEGFWPLQLPIFYNGNGVGLRPWVNFVWSSPDFRVTIYDGNGHISPARKTRFGFDHILSHPILHPLIFFQNMIIPTTFQVMSS